MAKRNNPTPEQIAEGARIKQLRKAAGFMKTAEVAAATGLGADWINVIERGRADAPLWMILLYETMIALRKEQGLPDASAGPTLPRYHYPRKEHSYRGYKIIPKEGECRDLEPSGIHVRYWSIMGDAPDGQHQPDNRAYRTIQEARDAIDFSFEENQNPTIAVSLTHLDG